MTVEQVIGALARRGNSMRLVPSVSTSNKQTYMLDRGLDRGGSNFIVFCRGILTGYISNMDGGFHVFLAMANKAKASYGEPTVRLQTDMLPEGPHSAITLEWLWPESVRYSVTFSTLANSPNVSSGIWSGPCQK